MIHETRITQIVCDGVNKKEQKPCTKGLVIEKPEKEAVAEAGKQGWVFASGRLSYCPEHS